MPVQQLIRVSTLFRKSYHLSPESGDSAILSPKIDDIRASVSIRVNEASNRIAAGIDAKLGRTVEASTNRAAHPEVPGMRAQPIIYDVADDVLEDGSAHVAITPTAREVDPAGITPIAPIPNNVVVSAADTESFVTAPVAAVDRMSLAVAAERRSRLAGVAAIAAIIIVIPVVIIPIVIIPIVIATTLPTIVTPAARSEDIADCATIAAPLDVTAALAARAPSRSVVIAATFRARPTPVPRPIIIVVVAADNDSGIIVIGAPSILRGHRIRGSES